MTGTFSETVRGAVMMFSSEADAPMPFGTEAGVQLAATPQFPLALRFHVCASETPAQVRPAAADATSWIDFFAVLFIASTKRTPRASLGLYSMHAAV